jgi:hypothetical protein
MGVMCVASRITRLLVLVCLVATVMPVPSAGAYFDPFVGATKVTVPGGTSGQAYATSVAIDGDTLVGGAPWAGVGAAYVQRRVLGVWTPDSPLALPPGVTSDQFGFAVAVDGDTVVVGDRTATTHWGSSSGCVSIYVRNGATWSLEATLTGPDSQPNDLFGSSVAIEGNRLAVGAAYSNEYGVDSGAAFVFERTGSTWSAGELLPATGLDVNDFMGVSIALSGDTIAVGAADDDGPSNAQNASGAVHVFAKGLTGWTEQAIVRAATPTADSYLGRRIALAGETLLASADMEAPSGANSGAAYVFTRSGATWGQQQRLVASDGVAGARFGWGVALAGDTAVVGAHGVSVGGATNAGAAYSFQRSGTTWSQQQKLTAADASTNAEFGFALGISGDTLAVGAPNDPAGGSGLGAVYAYRAVPVATTVTIKTTATSARIGGAPILSGRVTPAGLIGKNMVVYVKKPGKRYWSYSSNRTMYSIAGNGAWYYKYTFKRGMKKGYYYFKATVPTMAGYLTSTSPTISIRLR